MPPEPTLRPELRRQASRSLDAGDEPELVERLVDEIRASGPITFARFMERALYEPGLGYYRRPRAGPGRAGDFLTAPETHPIFGRTLARQLDEVWRRLGQPDPFVVREHGAGEGALAVAMLDGLTADRSGLLEAVRYQPIEVEAARVEALTQRLADAGHAGRLDDRSPDAEPLTGAVIGNEVLDALPVHRVERRNGVLYELLVDRRDGRFVEVLAEPSTPELAARLDRQGVVLAEGQRAEISLAIDPWIEGVAQSLGRGCALLIDYGHPAAELYGPRRMAGSLVAYVNHRAHGDPFVNVGRQDLTAHVDLDAVVADAAGAGLDHLGTTTQAEFLVALGVEEVLRGIQADEATTLEAYTSLRSGLMRLLDPAATGRFAVLAFGRGLAPAPPLRGFTYRLARPPAAGSSPAAP